MAKNELTALQDVTTREFLVDVALAENVFGNHPSLKKQLIGLLYELLNYRRLPDGRFIAKDKTVKYLLGGTISREEYPDEWSKDYARALKALDGGDNASNERKVRSAQKDMFATDYNDTDEADSGKPSKNPSLWKTILSKDV